MEVDHLEYIEENMGPRNKFTQYLHSIWLGKKTKQNKSLPIQQMVLAKLNIHLNKNETRFISFILQKLTQS